MMRFHVFNAACILSVIALCHIKMTLAGGPRKMCPAGKWRCSNNKCINTKFRCNGGSQCGNDELSCEQWTCPANRWKCSNERCIPLPRKCNGNDDCGDNSDEENCGNLLMDCPSYVMEKSNVSCTCRTKTVTKPYSITWPGHSQSGSLTLTNVQRSDNGTQYTCLLTADGVREEAVYTLRVAYGPYNGQVKITPSLIIRNGSQPVTLTCTAEDTYPTPHYEWGGVPCQKPAADNTCTFIPDPTFDPGHTVTCRAESVTLNTFQQFHESVRGTATESTPMNITFSTPDCGFDMVANTSQQSFRSPIQDANNMYCVWHIRAPEGQVLWLVFDHLEYDNRKGCREDFVNVLVGNETNHGTNICLASSAPRFQTTSGLLTVMFRSNYRIRRVSARYHFQALYQTIPDCGGDIHVNRSIQTIQSPGYPANYMSNLECVWTVTAPPGFYVKFNFTDFDLDWGRDNVYIYDGERGSGKVLGRFHSSKDRRGKATFNPLISLSNNATIVFQTNYGRTFRRGFNLEVKATKRFRCPNFQCNNGVCVWKKYRCDGIDNCGDNSDEENCDKHRTGDSCKGFYDWKCSNSSQCIYDGKRGSKRCDGENDCADGSDEQHCGLCKGTAWKCGTSRQCIKSSQRCDGNTDCTNGSDEQNCV